MGGDETNTIPEEQEESAKEVEWRQYIVSIDRALIDLVDGKYDKQSVLLFLQSILGEEFLEAQLDNQHVYDSDAFQGFSVWLSQPQVRQLRLAPAIKFMEEDRVVTLSYPSASASASGENGEKDVGVMYASIDANQGERDVGIAATVPSWRECLYDRYRYFVGSSGVWRQG